MSIKARAAVVCAVLLFAGPAVAVTEPDAEASRPSLSEELKVASADKLRISGDTVAPGSVLTWSVVESRKDDAIYLLAGAFFGLAYLSRVARRGRKLRSSSATHDV